jgi:hypothetical protein
MICGAWAIAMPGVRFNPVARLGPDSVAKLRNRDSRLGRRATSISRGLDGSLRGLREASRSMRLVPGLEDQVGFAVSGLHVDLDGLALAARLFTSGDRRALGFRECLEGCQSLTVETQVPPAHRCSEGIGGVLFHENVSTPTRRCTPVGEIPTAAALSNEGCAFAVGDPGTGSRFLEASDGACGFPCVSEWRAQVDRRLARAGSFLRRNGLSAVSAVTEPDRLLLYDKILC